MKELSRLTRLEMLKASVLDCISEGINMGDMVARVEAEIKKERQAVRWSCVCPIVNGCATDAVYEGTEADCAEYTHQHPELHGNCIISPLY